MSVAQTRAAVKVALQPQGVAGGVLQGVQRGGNARSGAHKLQHDAPVPQGRAQKKAAPQRIQHRAHDLAAARGLKLPIRAVVINIGADGVARRVVGPLRGCGVGDAHPLDAARVISGHALIFHHGHMAAAKNHARHRGPGAKNTPKRGAAAYFLQGRFRRCGIAVGQRPGVHGHAQRHAQLNGVAAKVIAQPVEAGYGVQIAYVQIGSKHAEIFVFHRRTQGLALLVGENIGTLDEAAGHAGMGYAPFAAAGQNGVMQGLGIDAVLAGKATQRKVARGQRAERVRHVHDSGCAVFAVGFRRLRRAVDMGGQLLHGGAEGRLIGTAGPGSALGVPNDGLNALAAHNRAKAAAPVEPRGHIVGIGIGDARGVQAHFAAGADEGQAHLVAVTAEQGFSLGIDAHARQIRAIVKAHAVHAHMQHSPVMGIFRHILQHQRAYAQPAHHVGGGSPGVAFLDAAGERTFCAYGQTVDAGGQRARQRPAGQRQLVVRPQRVAGGGHFGMHQRRGQGAGAQQGLLRRQRGAARAAGAAVDANDTGGSVHLSSRLRVVDAA